MKYIFAFFIIFFFIACSNPKKITIPEEQKEEVKTPKIIPCKDLDNKKEKIDCYLKKANENDFEAQQKVVDYYLFENDYSTAIYWLEKLSDKNDIDATKKLALMYHNGDGVPKNHEKAYKYFLILAKSGDAQIQRELAYYYKHGIGTIKNFKEAYYWYEKSALLNDEFSMSELGYFYTKGLGVEQNYDVAFEWFSKAANYNSSYSMSWLGYFYEMGYSVAQDFQKAKYWYEKSNTKYSLKRLEILKNKGLI